MKKGNYFLLLVLFITGFIQAQDPEVVLTISPTSADVGEIIKITVKSNVQGKVEIDNLPSSFVHGYDVMNGMEQEMDYATGQVITYFYVSQTGAIGKKGKYTIGPAFIKKGNKAYASNSVVISIGERAEMSSNTITAEQLKNPAFGVIQTNKTSIYEGESIIVSAKIYARFEPTHLEGYRGFDFPGTVDKNSLGSSKRIIVEQEMFKSVDLYTFEYDKNIIFPSGVGQFKISPYTMKLNQNYKGYQFESNHAIITIKALPNSSPNDFIGAVGKFTIEREIEDVDLDQGDVFKMLIRIIGSGNLQNITEPRPILPKGFIVYGDPEIEEIFIYNIHGTEGEINYKYNIQVNKAGTTTIPPTTISFFDPKKEQYITVGTASVEIKVKKDKNYITQESEADENISELNAPSYLRKSNIIEDNSDFYGSTAFWVGVVSPIFAAFMFLFLAKRQKNTSHKNETKLAHKNKSNAIKELLLELSQKVESTNDDTFYSKAETLLLEALKLKLGTSLTNRKSLLDLLDKNGKDAVASEIRKVFTKCDQIRYGFHASSESRQEVLLEVKAIVNSLK